MRKTIAAFASLLMIGSSLEAQQMPDGSANRAAMQRLSGLIGRWTGEAWMMVGQQRENTTMTETVEAKLEGTVLLIEGLGVAPVAGGQTRIVHHALAILSFDPRTRTYSMRSHVGSGYSGDFAVEVTDSALVWTREVPQGRIRNTARIGNGVWHEIGEFSRDGTSWMQIMEIRLRKE
jgi:hypothetical protein